MAIVYKHTKPNGELFYVGIGVYKKRAYSKHGRNRYWHNTVNKYGYNVEILFSDISYNEAKSIESYLIKYYGRKDLGLGSLVNMTDGGEGSLNMNEEERRKRSKRLTAYNKEKKDYSFTQSKEYKENMSKATLNKGCKRIINTQTGKIYNSQKDASKDLGYSVSYLSEILNGKKPNKINLEWI